MGGEVDPTGLGYLTEYMQDSVSLCTLPNGDPATGQAPGATASRHAGALYVHTCVCMYVHTYIHRLLFFPDPPYVAFSTYVYTSTPSTALGWQSYFYITICVLYMSARIVNQYSLQGSKPFQRRSCFCLSAFPPIAVRCHTLSLGWISFKHPSLLGSKHGPGTSGNHNITNM
jgi:hypothetical protein